MSTLLVHNYCHLRSFRFGVGSNGWIFWFLFRRARQIALSTAQERICAILVFAPGNLHSSIFAEVWYTSYRRVNSLPTLLSIDWNLDNATLVTNKQHKLNNSCYFIIIILTCKLNFWYFNIYSIVSIITLYILLVWYYNMIISIIVYIGYF